MHCYSLRSLFFICILEFSTGYGVLFHFPQSMKAQAFESHKFKTPLFQGRLDIDKIYAQAKPSSNQNVFVLGEQLQEFEMAASYPPGRDQIKYEIQYKIQGRTDAIIKQLVLIGSEEAYTVLSLGFIHGPYTKEKIINTLAFENPSALFRIAKKASKQLSNRLSPVDLFLPSLTGDIFGLMAPFDQESVSQGSRAEDLRINAVAALAYADYDVTNELIAALPSPILFAALIEVIAQDQLLWCGRPDPGRLDPKMPNKIVSFSNNVLKRIGPQFIPTLEAAVQSNPDPYSDAYSALTNLQSALNDSNLNQYADCEGGGAGSWGDLYRGVINILKPNRR